MVKQLIVVYAVSILVIFLALRAIIGSQVTEAATVNAKLAAAAKPKIILASAQFSDAATATLAQASPSLNQIEQMIQATSGKYGLNYNQLYAVIRCESKFQNIYGDHGLAFGVAQFHRATFNKYCEGNYYSAQDQITCMAQMFKNGQAGNWSCFKELYGNQVLKTQ